MWDCGHSMPLQYLHRYILRPIRSVTPSCRIEFVSSLSYKMQESYCSRSRSTLVGSFTGTEVHAFLPLPHSTCDRASAKYIGHHLDRHRCGGTLFALCHDYNRRTGGDPHHSTAPPSAGSRSLLLGGYRRLEMLKLPHVGMRYKRPRQLSLFLHPFRAWFSPGSWTVIAHDLWRVLSRYIAYQTMAI